MGKGCSYVQDTDEKFAPLGQNPKNKLWLAQPHQTEPQSKLKPISNPKPIQNPELDLHKLAAVCLDQNSFSKDSPMFRIPMKNLPPWDRTPKYKLLLAQTHTYIHTQTNTHTNTLTNPHTHKH